MSGKYQWYKSLWCGAQSMTCAGTASQIVNEVLIDFHRVDRELLQIGQRGVAGSKIIDGKANAHLLEPRHDAEGHFGIVHGDGFGDLDIQRPRGKAGLFEDALDARFRQQV